MADKDTNTYYCIDGIFVIGGIGLAVLALGAYVVARFLA